MLHNSPRLSASILMIAFGADGAWSSCTMSCNTATMSSVDVVVGKGMCYGNHDSVLVTLSPCVSRMYTQ